GLGLSRRDNARDVELRQYCRSSARDRNARDELAPGIPSKERDRECIRIDGCVRESSRGGECHEATRPVDRTDIQLVHRCVRGSYECDRFNTVGAAARLCDEEQRAALEGVAKE